MQIEASVIVLDPIAFDLERCVGLGIESAFACDKTCRFQLLQLPRQVSVALVAKSFTETVNADGLENILIIISSPIY